MTTLIHIARALDALNYAPDSEAGAPLIEQVHKALGERYIEFQTIYRDLAERAHKAPAMAAVCRMGAQSIPAEMPPLPEPQPDPRWIKFLAGLAALSKETGVAIMACGCCRSPWLFETQDVERYTVDQNGERLTATLVGGQPAREASHG